MAKNDGGQAFPCVREGVNNESPIVYHQGMTRRQWLVGLSMQGLVSNSSMIDGCSDTQVDWLVKSSYTIADAILAYEEKEGKE